VGILAIPGIASQVLASFGVYTKNARVAISDIAGYGSGFVPREIPYTPRAARVFELAAQSAHNLTSDLIGTEHLLLGLLGEREGVAIRALENLGVDLEALRQRVLNVIKGMDVPPAATAVNLWDTCEKEEGRRASSLEEAVDNLCATYSFVKPESV